MTEQSSGGGELTARGVLAHELRRQRELSGKSLSQLSEDTTYDRSYLHRLETGERLSQLPVMQALDEVYDAGDLIVRLWRLAQQQERFNAFMDRYRLFMQYESRARVMHKFMSAIPGLLQTEEYARVVLASSGLDPTELDEQVSARIGRQELLYRKPPPSVRVILDEGALRRPTKDRQVWHDQLAHLVKAAQTPNIVLQVLPFDSGVHDLMGGSLSILWAPDGTSVAYLEGNKSGELVEDPEEVTALRLSYDELRDFALSPGDSEAFITQIMEDFTP